MSPKASEKTSTKSFDELKKRAERMRSTAGKRITQMEESRTAYRLESTESPKGSDGQDVKLTISPTPRNMVVGGVRLVTGTDPVFELTSRSEGKGDANKAQVAADRMWQASCEQRRAKVHVDTVRSALLYSDVHLCARSVVDILKSKTLLKEYRPMYEELLERTPDIYECISPLNGFFEYNQDGFMSAYLRVRKLAGSRLREEYGVKDAKDEEEKTVLDIMDTTWRAVWLEGSQEPLPDFNGPHGLAELPYVVELSDGSELFEEEEFQRQPFLYAYLKSKLWDRETLALTSLFTSLFERGTGPLISVEGDDEVVINWAGGVRYVRGKAQLLNDKAFDPDMVQALNMLAEMSGDSLLYRQALGQAVGGAGTAFSTVALLSQAGRLPMVSPSEAVGKAMAKISAVALRRLRTQNDAPDFIKGTDIPEKFTLKCRLEVKLPQDNLRNAQIGETLTQGETPITSVEWVREQILGINDSDAMDKQILEERYKNMRFGMKAQEMIAQFQTQLKGPGAAAPGSRTTPPPGVDPAMAARAAAAQTSSAPTGPESPGVPMGPGAMPGELGPAGPGQETAGLSGPITPPSEGAQ